MICALVATAHADDGADTAFERGLARFQARDYAGAIVSLVQAHREDPSDPDTALLLAIAYYRLDQDDAARPLFAQAERMGEVKTRDSARMFLGMLAAAHGDADQARAFYALVADSGTSDLRASANRLLQHDQRWSVAAVIRPEYDSNVSLLANNISTAMLASARDADLLLVLRATGQPLDEVPIFFDETTRYRKQVQLSDFDFLGVVAGSTYLHAGPVYRASVAYHIDASTLGGSRYTLGHVGDVIVQRSLGPRYAIAAHYTLADRGYTPAAYAGYSGVSHTGVASLMWSAPSRDLEVDLGYVLAREGADDPALAATANGARAEVRIRPWVGADLRVALAAVHRAFDDKASGGRIDNQLDGDASLYVELASALGVVAAVSLLRNASTDADYDHTKWTMSVGLVVVMSSL